MTAGSPQAFDAELAEKMRQHFRPDEYLELYPDVAAVGMDPFEHYIGYGWYERRKPSKDFDVEFYSVAYMRDDPFACALAHFASVGAARGYLLNAAQLDQGRWLWRPESDFVTRTCTALKARGADVAAIRAAGLGMNLRAMFSATAFRSRHGLDPEIDDDECFLRYLTQDFLADVAPGPMFDRAFYLSRAEKTGLPPLEPGQTAYAHWARHGTAARIVPNKVFNAREYVHLNPDLANYGAFVFEHFLRWGMTERRQFTVDAQILSIGERPDLNNVERFLETVLTSPGQGAEFQSLVAFRKSDRMRELVREAVALEPAIGLHIPLENYLPPWHDGWSWLLKDAFDRLPERRYKAVIVIPFCKVGGADYVAGILSQVLAELAGDVLVIQTDQEEFDRPDWFSDKADRLDLSDILREIPNDIRTRLLHALFMKVRPEQIINVNSRLAFDTFVRYGKRLSRVAQLYAYYFCADRNRDGVQVGYPIWYFANIFDSLSAAITDSRDLADDLAQRYGLTDAMRARLVTAYTPAMTPGGRDPLVRGQLKTGARRERPALIWAGRFDRQKRFDILLDVARLMPEIDFLCWGKAVLDAPPDLSQVPPNVQINAPFTSYDELPLNDVDGFFYTSDWDGVPTILIELGGMGMPIVASASGGVPELVDGETGWPVDVGSPPEVYAAEIRKMLADPAARLARATALRNRVRQRHSVEAYRATFKTLLEGGKND